MSGPTVPTDWRANRRALNAGAPRAQSPGENAQAAEGWRATVPEDWRANRLALCALDERRREAQPRRGSARE